MRRTYKITASALFLALGMVMPFLIGQIPQFGNMMLPMHIPVLVCGYVCGGPWGALVGFVLPLLRSALLGMPPMLPTALCMAVELATYGACSGWLYPRMKKARFGMVWTLLVAMVVGRIAWGLTSTIIYHLMGMEFLWEMFLAGAFVQAVPGILLQLIGVPAIVSMLKSMGVMRE